MASGDQLGGRHGFDLSESPQRRRDAKALERDRQGRLLEEALYLMAEAGLSPRLVGQRLGLTPSVLRRLVLRREPDPALLQRQPRRGARFHKIHERAVNLLRERLAAADHPLTLRELQSDLAQHCGLRVSRPWLGKFLRERL